MNRTTRRGRLLAAGALLWVLAATAAGGDGQLQRDAGRARAVDHQRRGSTRAAGRRHLPGRQASQASRGNLAQVDIGGKTQIPAPGWRCGRRRRPGGGSGGSRIVLPVGSGGHYTGLGSINGHPMRFVVDTGATTIAMGSTSPPAGPRSNGQHRRGAMTANGAVAARSSR